MNIPRAIKLNDESYDSLANHGFPDHAKAIRLGTEALKREEKRRRFAIPDKVDLLPGETIE